MEGNKRKCSVVGSPITHSKSPYIFNSTFKKLDLQYEYIALETRNPEYIINKMRDDNYRGYSVTSPLKVDIVKYLDKIDPLAKKIGSINTIVNDDNVLKGYNTDCRGAIASIEEKIDLKNKKIIILGAGGAARAIAFGLKELTSKILILNRTLGKAKALAKDLNCSYDLLSQSQIGDCDLVINTTTVGMYPDVNKSITIEFTESCTVMDIIYNPIETMLIQRAKKEGCSIITGEQMFINQAVEQFKLFTDINCPKEIMNQAFWETIN